MVVSPRTITPSLDDNFRPAHPISSSVAPPGEGATFARWSAPAPVSVVDVLAAAAVVPEAPCLRRTPGGARFVRRGLPLRLYSHDGVALRHFRGDFEYVTSVIDGVVDAQGGSREYLHEVIYLCSAAVLAGPPLKPDLGRLL